MIPIFLQSLLIGFSGAIMPGSLLTYTLDKSMKSGAKAGLFISAGHALLELALVILLFIGAGNFLKARLPQIIIGLLGGIVLIFFGAGMIKDVLKGKISIDFKDGAQTRSGSLMLAGAVISASNPYFIVWWAAIGLGLVMKAYAVLGIIGVAMFYIGHILADFTWYTFISTLIAKTRHFISLKLYRLIIVFLGICLVAFAAGFLVSSIQLALA